MIDPVTPSVPHDDLFDRMVRAVEKVRERLLRATAALEHAGVAYAVIGGNAVAAWVASVDESGVRNTPNVDILLRRADQQAARLAWERVGFTCVCPTLFLDSPEARIRSAVQVIFAVEKVRAGHLLPTPDVADFRTLTSFRVTSLEALVRMKLVSFRTIDKVHLRDILDVSLIDASWLTRLPPELAARLKQLIDTPEG